MPSSTSPPRQVKMPSQNSLWIVTAPVDSSPDEQLEDLEAVLGNAKAGVNASSLLGRGGKLGDAVPFEFPEFKVSLRGGIGTLGVHAELGGRGWVRGLLVMRKREQLDDKSGTTAGSSPVQGTARQHYVKAPQPKAPAPRTGLTDTISSGRLARSPPSSPSPNPSPSTISPSPPPSPKLSTRSVPSSPLPPSQASRTAPPLSAHTSSSTTAGRTSTTCSLRARGRSGGSGIGASTGRRARAWRR